MAAVRSAAILYAPMGSGWHYAYHVASATRHTWFLAPNTVRPFEYADFLSALNLTRAIVTCAAPDAREPPISELLPLPPAFAAAVYSRLEPRLTS